MTSNGSTSLAVNFVQALINQAYPELSDNEKKAKLAVVMSNFAGYASEQVSTEENKQSSESKTVSRNIRNACKENDYKLFLSLVPKASPSDLEHCIEISTDCDIIKYLIEEKKIVGFESSTYINAVICDNVELVKYLESKLTRNLIIKNILVEIDKYEDTNPDGIEQQSLANKLTELKATRREIEKAAKEFYPDE